MKKYSKNNDTALRGLELLLLLTQDEKAFNEAIKHCSEEVLYKYVTTYNMAGLNIQKIQDKYVVGNMPLQLDLTEDEIKAFLYLEKTAQELQNPQMKQAYQEIFDNLKRYFSSENVVTYNRLNEQLKTDSITTQEIELIEKDDNYFHSSNITVFECYGRLIKNYKLKDFETIIDTCGDRLVVSNTNENRKDLIRRLLRYGENCKVLKPESFKQEVAKTIDGMIANLERNEA